MNTEDFGYSEPCRVKHPQMWQGVTSRCGLHYRALPGEGVFCLVKNVTGSIKSVEYYLSLTSCPCRKKWIHTLFGWRICSWNFNTQGSTAGLSLSAAQRSNLLEHSKVSIRRVRDECCVWLIFVVTNTSTLERTFDVRCSVQKFKFNTSSVEKYSVTSMYCSVKRNGSTKEHSRAGKLCMMDCRQSAAHKITLWMDGFMRNILALFISSNQLLQQIFTYNRPIT